MSVCTEHREFLGALADGETELVPAATIDHVRDCRDCSREIQAHKALTRHLRAARDYLHEPAAKPLPRSGLRRRAGLIAGTVAAAVLIAGVAAAWNAFATPDPVRAAVQASAGPLQIQSTDPNRVGAWCLNASGKSLPAIQLDGMQVVGARMDRAPSTDIVTVSYRAPDGAQVTVSWLIGRAPPGSGIEEKNLSGHYLLVVHSKYGTAVVLGSSNAAMWEAAAAIESTPA